MSSESFTLEPTPADPQPVRVFQLDDCTWWAGYSLQSCIKDARLQDFCDEERGARELSPEEMDGLQLVDDRDDPNSAQRSFAAELQRRINAGEQFPQLFGCTEY